MSGFFCKACDTDQYLWVLVIEPVEPKRVEFRMHQGGQSVERNRPGYAEVRFFCRGCGEHGSMRVTDLDAIPEPFEVLDDVGVLESAGVIFGSDGTQHFEV